MCKKISLRIYIHRKSATYIIGYFYTLKFNTKITLHNTIKLCTLLKFLNNSYFCAMKDTFLSALKDAMLGSIN